MKESVGYTVTLNIVIIFIVIVFAFISFALIYYKANKVNKVITNSIEKYEGYNALSEKEINEKLNSIGYSRKANTCKEKVSDCSLVENSDNVENGRGTSGYCVYYCIDDGGYYHYKVRTNMNLNIPIINDIVNVPVYSSTILLYDFEAKLGSSNSRNGENNS